MTDHSDFDHAACDLSVSPTNENTPCAELCKNPAAMYKRVSYMYSSAVRFSSLSPARMNNVVRCAPQTLTPT
jgi:hypothetical protein